MNTPWNPHTTDIYKHLIHDEWVDGHAVLRNTNPANLGDLVGEYAAADAHQLDQAVQAAQAALAKDFTPLTDMRASSGYRLKVAQNLFTKLWLETSGASTAPVGVWLSMQEATA